MGNKIENKLKSKDIFYAIIAIATLIVAIIGATLAYFSITASSEEGAVNARAAVVSITYDDGRQVSAAADELIPATLEVVKAAYINAKDVDQAFDADGTIEQGDPNVCIDSNGKQVCSIYRFSMTSDREREISAKLLNENNTFSYLAFAMYDVTNSAWLQLVGSSESMDINRCDNTNKDPATDELDTSDDCFTVTGGIKTYTNGNNPGQIGSAVNSLFGLTDSQLTELTLRENTQQTYDLVLFLKENGNNQNIDQGATYSGTIQVEVGDSGNSGRITGWVNNN